MSEAKLFKLCLLIAEKTPESMSAYARWLSRYDKLSVSQILKACIALQNVCPALIAEYRDAYFDFKSSTNVQAQHDKN